MAGEHIHCAGQISGYLAEAFGLPGEQVDYIERLAKLHNAGRIGISDHILLKPWKLTPLERAVVETHTLIGARIQSNSQVIYLQMAEEFAVSHDGHWDGSGYPRGLAGVAIPLAGRIVAVAVVLDALTHERPYKRAWRMKETISKIAGQRGR